LLFPLGPPWSFPGGIFIALASAIQKGKIMKSISLFMSCLLLGSLASAQTNTLKKLLDGSARYCQSSADVSREIRVALSLNSDQSVTVRMVRCALDTKTNENRYVLDQPLTPTTYTAPNGDVVTEKYERFELVAVDAQDNIIATAPLNSLSNTSQENVSLSNLRLQSGDMIFVRAFKSYQSVRGVSDQGIITWGAFRLL
jgi:hypothetical protein